ncbi:MAG: hypothetical protein K0S78_2818 [Thermomicrobiales bacterium]|jgi:hypothetical protein|nr:hypothetical protein [Thermomicrobiales bacterium]
MSMSAIEPRSLTTAIKNLWPIVLGIAVGLVVIQGLELDASLSVLALVIAAIYLPIGAVRKQLGRPHVLWLETLGVIVFAALALGALYVDRQLAQFLLAAAFFGHAAWDFAHHRADKVVPRWYAEFCIVADVIIGVGILALP